jgi:hypothetical protein
VKVQDLFLFVNIIIPYSCILELIGINRSNTIKIISRLSAVGTDVFIVIILLSVERDLFRMVDVGGGEE